MEISKVFSLMGFDKCIHHVTTTQSIYRTLLLSPKVPSFPFVVSPPTPLQSAF